MNRRRAEVTQYFLFDTSGKQGKCKFCNKLYCVFNATKVMKHLKKSCVRCPPDVKKEISQLSHLALEPIVDQINPREQGTSMTSSSSSHIGCCHQSCINLSEIKEELRTIKHTVDVAVKLLSKLVGVTADDIQTAVSSSTISTTLSVPVVDSHSVVNTCEVVNIDDDDDDDDDEAIDTANQNTTDSNNGEIDSTDESENDMFVDTNASFSSTSLLKGKQRDIFCFSSTHSEITTNNTAVDSSQQSSDDTILQECDSCTDNSVCSIQEHSVSSHVDLKVNQSHSQHSEAGLGNVTQCTESYTKPSTSDADVQGFVMQNDSRASNTDTGQTVHVLEMSPAHSLSNNEARACSTQSVHHESADCSKQDFVAEFRSESQDADCDIQTSDLQPESKPVNAKMEIQTCFTDSSYSEFPKIDSVVETYVPRTDTRVCVASAESGDADADITMQSHVTNYNLESLNLESSIQVQIESVREPVQTAVSIETVNEHLEPFIQSSAEIGSCREEALPSECLSLVPVPEMNLPSSASVSSESIVSPSEPVGKTASILENVSLNIEVNDGRVKVKQEQLSDCDDVGVSVINIQPPEEVKKEAEDVFINEAMVPECLLIKKEEEFYGSIQEKAASSGVNRTPIYNLLYVGGSSVTHTPGCNLDQQSRSSSCELPSPLKPLFGSALVSKLKQKIQEKIQATVATVQEVNIADKEQKLPEIKEFIENPTHAHDNCRYLEKASVIKSRTFGSIYQCGICAKVFVTKTGFQKHKEQCLRSRKQYHCNFCPLIFHSRTILFNHRRLHSTNKCRSRHKCEKCGRDFALKSTLKQHRLSQACSSKMKFDQRRMHQYFCVDCGEGFLNASNLALHQKLHEVDQTKLSNASDTKVDSSEIVTKAVRRYQCSYCNEAFVDRRSVTLHEKLHTDKEFSAFNQQRKMIQKKYQLIMMLKKQQQHQQQQTAKKKFVCKVCGRLYPIELLLDMHTRLHHAIS